MSDFEEKVKGLNNTADYTEEMDPQDIEKNKVMAVLAYLGILVLIPLFAAKDSKFARFHCGQGLVLLIAEVIVSVVASILGLIPVVRVIFGIISGLLGLCFLVLLIIGIVNAVNGKAKELPVIGKFRLFK